MTEPEWLACEDPKLMLDGFLTTGTPLWHLVASRTPGGVPDEPLISPRKLRLFACACCWSAGPDLGRAAEQCVEQNSEPATNAAGWAMAWAGDQKKPSATERAALLRSIVGNPFRPVTLPMVRRCLRCGKQPPDLFWTICPFCQPTLSGFKDSYPLLTPRVLALAQAAYEEREEAGCLDPCRLAVLSDALEEEGCTDEVILQALRGREVCPECCFSSGKVPPSKATYFQLVLGQDNDCRSCKGTGFIPARCKPMRGFWCLDIILGKE